AGPPRAKSDDIDAEGCPSQRGMAEKQRPRGSGTPCHRPRQGIKCALHGRTSMLIRLLAAAALAVAAVAAVPAPAKAAEPVFTTRPCPADWAGGARTVECGTLTVDEARDGSGGRRIDIAVAIVRASAPFRDAA